MLKLNNGEAGLHTLCQLMFYSYKQIPLGKMFLQKHILLNTLFYKEMLKIQMLIYGCKYQIIESMMKFLIIQLSNFTKEQRKNNF